MTREEAVKRLEDYKNVMIESIPSDKMQEALDVAIEALKYDVDKVIAELEYISWGYCRIEEMYKKGAVSLSDAVKIIRRGGK